jgi:hypothetical protein
VFGAAGVAMYRRQPVNRMVEDIERLETQFQRLAFR